MHINAIAPITVHQNDMYATNLRYAPTLDYGIGSKPSRCLPCDFDQCGTHFSIMHRAFQRNPRRLRNQLRFCIGYRLLWFRIWFGNRFSLWFDRAARTREERAFQHGGIECRGEISSRRLRLCNGPLALYCLGLLNVLPPGSFRVKIDK